MSNTAKDIVNKALALLASPPVGHFDPESDEFPDTVAGQTIAGFYDWSVEEAQSMYSWQELLMESSVQAEGQRDSWGRNVFPYMQEIPDVLRVLGVRTVGEEEHPSLYSVIQPTDSNVSYEISGGKIFSWNNVESLQVSYIGKELDPSKWSPELSRVVIYTIASNSAFSITQNGDLSMMLFQKLQEVVLPMAQFMQAGSRTSVPLNPQQTGFVIPPQGLSTPGGQPQE